MLCCRYITRTEAENAWMDRVLLPLFAKKSRNDKDVLRAKFAMIAIVSRWTERFPDFPKYTNSLEQESSFFSSSFSRSTSNLSLSDLLTNNYYPKPNSSEKPLSLSVRKCLGSISVFALSKIGQFLTQKRYQVLFVCRLLVSYIGFLSNGSCLCFQIPCWR